MQGRPLIGFPSVGHPREAILEMETQDPHVGPVGSRHVSLPAASQVQADDGSGSIFSSRGCRQHLEVGKHAGLPGRPKGTAIPGRQNTALRLKRMLCGLCSCVLFTARPLSVGGVLPLFRLIRCEQVFQDVFRESVQASESGG